VGKSTAYAERVKQYVAEHGLEQRVLFFHKLPYADLPAFYRLASVFVYPSRFEGFGIPILEAIRSEVPVVAATGSCLEEAGGPDCLYVDPDDEVRLADCIHEVLSHPATAQRMVERSLDYAHRFDKEQIGAAMMKVINSMV
jgi:glycosyltransferase involved in cell wall biosynthesis